MMAVQDIFQIRLGFEGFNILVAVWGIHVSSDNDRHSLVLSSFDVGYQVLEERLAWVSDVVFVHQVS